MKKILLAICLISSPLYADTITSGNLGLLLPSTGAVDTTRSWADKINTNFEIISSTVGDLEARIDDLGQRLSFSSAPRIATVLIETVGALGVDFTGNTETAFESALELVGALGITSESTAPATIFLKEGVYQYSGTTVPAGIKFFGTEGSSTVIVLGAGTVSMFDVWGTLEGITLDFGNKDFRGEVIRQHDNSIVDVTVTNNMSLGAISNATAGSFMIVGATNTKTNIWYREFSFAGQDRLKGGLITIIRSTEVFVTIETDTGTVFNAGSQGVFVMGSKDVHIDGIYNNVGGRGIKINGGNIKVHVNGQHNLTKEPGANGYVDVSAANGGTSTQTFITADFTSSFASVNEIIGQSNTTDVTSAVNIIGCTHIYTGGGSRPTFIVLNSGAKNFVIGGNSVYGATFKSDAGEGTVLFDNFEDGILD